MADVEEIKKFVENISEWYKKAQPCHVSWNYWKDQAQSNGGDIWLCARIPDHNFPNSLFFSLADPEMIEFLEELAEKGFEHVMEHEGAEWMFSRPMAPNHPLSVYGRTRS